MEVSTSSPAAARVVLAASSIAAHLARAKHPPDKDLFVLSAAVAEAAKTGDLLALELAVDSVGALLEQLPDRESRCTCRGHLKAVREFAWLLREPTPESPPGSPSASSPSPAPQPSPS